MLPSEQPCGGCWSTCQLNVQSGCKMSVESSPKRADSSHRDRRERSPRRTQSTEIRTRSPTTTRSSTADDASRGRAVERAAIPAADDTGDMMRQLMGFDTFDSTKGKHVEGTDKSGVKKKKKARFRQYMNREKGFNRPLSPERSGPKKTKTNITKPE